MVRFTEGEESVLLSGGNAVSPDGTKSESIPDRLIEKKMYYLNDNTSTAKTLDKDPKQIFYFVGIEEDVNRGIHLSYL